MADIDGGSLSFKSIMDNDQMDGAIEETLRRVQGLTDSTVSGGKAMETAFDATADNIRNALGAIGAACSVHEATLQDLEMQYQDLGQKAGAAFTAGRDKEYSEIKKQQDAIRGEIKTRQSLLSELREQSNALEVEAAKQEENKQKTESNTKAHQSFRSQIRLAREELIAMEQAGERGTAAYAELQQRLGQLQDAYDDASTQARVLANDQASFQGVITGLSGVAGGFSAATGAISLFAGENENLQLIMTKVQSLMAITMGLQQVSQALNKDSAFMLVTINGLKQWWAGIVAQATVAETAETVAITANTVAQEANSTATVGATTTQVANTVATGAQAGAAVAGTAANLGLAGAFRAVGLAIKSIPVFGWIVAGISALATAAVFFTSKARAAKKAQEEFTASIIDGCYKPIGSIEALSVKYTELGDNIEAKQQFVEANKKAFEELGVAVNSVTDAENLLMDNKDAFVDAQVAKAKAAIYLQQATENVKKQMELEAEISNMSDKQTVYVSNGYGSGYSYETENKAKAKKQKELEDLKAEITAGYENAALAESEGLKKLEEAGIKGANTYDQGTIGAIEQAIAKKQAALKLLTNKSDYDSKIAEIEKLQKQMEGITGKVTKTSTTTKDPFVEKLDKYKAEYTRFQKWVNSGDDVLAKAASSEFDSLLKQGATFIDYLKNQRDTILSVDVANRTKAQNEQLRTLNNTIAEETKKTVLETFNAELSDQLSNARTTLEMLNIIEQKRKDLANDGTEVDNAQGEALDDAEKDVLKQQKDDSDALLEQYSTYLDKRVKLHEQYFNDIQLLEERLKKAQTPEEEASIRGAMKNRTDQYNADTKGSGDDKYDQMLQDYANFEQKKQTIIDEFDEKRKVAQEHGNTELVDSLNEAQAKALSSLAMDEMKLNPDWEKMFGNLDEVSTKKLKELLALFEGKTAFLGVEFDPKDLETIKNKVGEIESEIDSRNPFKAIASSFKSYSNAVDDESKKKALSNMFESASGAIDLVSGSLDAIVGGMETMGIEMDEQTQGIVNDIGGILDGASQLATGIATGNPLSIIQGAIGLLSSAFSLFNSRDRKADKQIKEHQKNLDSLTDAYEDLEKAIDGALGSERYSTSKAAIENLKKQNEELSSMADAERGKKKSDPDKVNEYTDAIEANNDAIKESIENMREQIMLTDAATAAADLGNAFIDAFAAGEDAAAAWGKKVDDIVGNIMRQMLIQKLLEPQIGKIMDKYSSQWYDENGNFAGYDTVINSADEMGNELKGVGTGFATAIEALPDEIKKYFTGEGSNVNASLEGAVKGVSEETAGIVAGQLNAVRINQVEATSILRQQLLQLNTIANNTAYLKGISEDVKSLRGKASSDPMRSKGLS